MEEEPIFIRTFGRSPVVKILNALLRGRELDYSMSDMARISKISWSTLNRVWNDLLKSNLVKYTRTIGKAKLYTLNIENQIVKDLIKIYNELLVQETENYFANPKIAIPA